MKQFLTVVLIAVALGGAFWGGTVAGKSAKSQNEVAGKSAGFKVQVESVLDALVKQYTKSLQRGVANAASVLSSNREFVLSYFHDRDMTSPVVRGIASQYGELLTVDGFEILTPGEGPTIISQFGLRPESGVADTTMQIIVENGTLWIGASSVAAIGKEELLLRGWIRVDSAKLESFSKTTQSDLILKNGENVLLSTFDADEKIHQISPELIIVDSVEIPVISVSLSDSLTLLSLIFREGAL